MKLNYNSLAIEVTRRCNSSCENFCMRGPVQNLDINNEFIDKLLSNDFGKVYCITFSGGEPTLNPDAISFCVDKIIDDNLDIAFLELVTNGFVYDERIAQAAKRFNKYNNEREITNIKDPDGHYDEWFQFHVSRDKYHDMKKDMSYKYSEDGLFVSDKRMGTLLNSGKSHEGEDLPTDTKNISILGDTVWTELYLTAKGNLSSFGDGDYGYLDKNASDYLVDDSNLEDFVFDRYRRKISHPNKEIRKTIIKRKVKKLISKII